MRGNPKARARQLRLRQTDAERTLLFQLRNRNLAGHKFRRQHPIGPYFADFACIERRLVVELDGGQHAARARYDDARTAFMCRAGWRVVSFWDTAALREMPALMERIHELLEAPPHAEACAVGGIPETSP